MVAPSVCDVSQYSLSVVWASFSQAVVAQRYLLAPVVEHGRPPVLFKAPQAFERNAADSYFRQRL